MPAPTDRRIAEVMVGGMEGVGPLLSICRAMTRLERDWRTYVGDTLAYRSHPLALERDVLVIAVENSSVMHDLRFKKHGILRKIRTELISGLADIRAEIANARSFDRRVIPRRARTSAPTTPRELDVERVDRAADDVTCLRPEIDASLAEAIARCMVASSDLCYNQKRKITQNLRS